MIPAELYLTIYLLCILYFTLLQVPKYNFDVICNLKYICITRASASVLLAGFLILFIGLRPISIIFYDTIAVESRYLALKDGDPLAIMTLGDFNFIYSPLMVFFSMSGIPVEVFFVFIAFIYFGGILIACKKIFSNATFLSFLVYLGAFSTFSYATNGIKAGAAASLFLVAIAYKNKLKIAIPFLFLSLGFHHSMIVPLVAYVSAYFFKKRKLYLFFWLLCLVMAALHITWFMVFFSGYTDDHGAAYLQEGTFVSGFRPDFILYSAIPIFLGNHLIKKYKIKSSYYDFIWNVYTLTNSVFLLCTYGTFINRIAYLSWLLYPIVLIYPFLNIVWSQRQDVYLKYTVWGHLGFTLFMMFIYYA